MLAKGRILGIQFEELFKDNLYFDISRKAVEQAERIKKAFLSKGYKLWIDSPTNQQFPILPKDAINKLKEKFAFSHLARYRRAETDYPFLHKLGNER